MLSVLRERSVAFAAASYYLEYFEYMRSTTQIHVFVFTFQVNNGFAALKQHIPLGHRSKKMSKVETLRCAVDYIKNLKTMLDPNGVFTSDEGSSAFDQLLDFGMGSGSGGSTQQLSPTSSEDPSSPSYASEGSYVASSGQPGGHGGGGSSNANSGLYDYENYEPVSPEDEELLDAISWWQQS